MDFVLALADGFPMPLLLSWPAISAARPLTGTARPALSSARSGGCLSRLSA